MVHMDDMTHRRAVSPVIATVILIAVAVAIGIAVAFWASGLTTSFSKYEQLGISAGWATKTASGSTTVSVGSTTSPTAATTGDWIVALQGTNTGSSAATLNQLQANGVPLTFSSTTTSFSSGGQWVAYVAAPGSSSYSQVTSGNPTVVQGGSFIIFVDLQASKYASGQTVEIALISASGTNYPKAIQLP